MDGVHQYKCGACLSLARIGQSDQPNPQTGYANSVGYGIAPDGRVIGTSYDTSGNARATRWMPGSSTGVDMLDSPGGAQGNTWVYAVNQQNRVCGAAIMASNNKRQALISVADALNLNSYEFGSYAGSSFESEALALNGGGQVVGDTQVSSTVSRPFLKQVPYGSA